MQRTGSKLLVFVLMLLSLTFVAQAALTNNLQAYYHYDNKYSNAVNSSYNVTIGSATFDAINKKLGTYSLKNVDQTNKVNYGNQNFGLTGAIFSIALWENTTNLANGTDQYLFSRTTSSAVGGFLIRTAGTGDNLVFQAIGSNGATKVSITSSGVNISDSKWHHIVVIQNITNAYVYVDNVQRGSQTNGTTTAWNGNVRTMVGRWDTPTNSSVLRNGEIDELAIWGKAITKTERTTLYNGGAGYIIPITSTFNTNLFNSKTSSQLSGYTIYLNGSSYFTSSSTKSFNITTNATSPKYNIIFQKLHYFNVSYNNYKTNVSLNGSIYPYTLLNMYDYKSVKILSFNATYNSTVKQTTNGSLWIPLNQNTNVTFSSHGYASSTHEVNTTPWLGTYNLTGVFYRNTVKLYFYNEANNSIIRSEKISVGFSSPTFYNTSSTMNGSYKLELLSPNDYIIQYNGTGYGNKFWYMTVVDNSAVTIYLYLTKEATTDVTFTVRDESGYVTPNVYVSILRQLKNQNSYLVVTMGKTDDNGQTILPVIKQSVLYELQYMYHGNIIYNTAAAPLNPYQNNLNNQFKSISHISVNSTSILNGVSVSLTNDWRSINNTNFNVTYIFNDPMSTISRGCVTVMDSLGATINRSCVSATAGSITVKVYNPHGAYKYLGSVVYSNYEYPLINKLLIIPTHGLLGETSMQTKENLFYVLLITLALGILGFLLTPILGLIFMSVGLISGIVMGILPLALGIEIILALLVIGALIGWRNPNGG